MNEKYELKVKILKFPKRRKQFIQKLYNKRHQFINMSDGSINIIKIMNILIDKLKPKINSKYVRNLKYTQLEFIESIINVLRNNTYWIRSREIIPGDYLRKMHKLYAKWKVYTCLYKLLCMIYFSKNKFGKLKQQSIDSTFIRNLYGTELIQRNKYYNHKNGIKVSAIDDRNGVPISIAIAKGAMYDGNIAILQIDDSFIDNDPKQVENNNRYCQGMYGDTHYSSKKLREILQNKGYKVFTDVNIGNTRDKNKLKSKYEAKRKYNKVKHKRAIKEISFGWLHKYPKLDRFVEKKISSYAGLLLLGLSLTIIKKIK